MSKTTRHLIAAFVCFLMALLILLITPLAEASEADGPTCYKEVANETHSTCILTDFVCEDANLYDRMWPVFQAEKGYVEPIWAGTVSDERHGNIRTVIYADPESEDHHIYVYLSPTNEVCLAGISEPRPKDTAL